MTQESQMPCAWCGGEPGVGSSWNDIHDCCLTRFFGNKVDWEYDRLSRDLWTTSDEMSAMRSSESDRAQRLGIAYKMFKRYLKKEYRVRQAEFGSRSIHEIAPESSAMLRDNARRRRLLMALRRVPLDLQVALELECWENMSAEEIGSVMGISPSHVRQILRRGRVMLEVVQRGLEVEEICGMDSSGRDGART